MRRCSFSQKDGSDWATTINTAYLSKNITGLQAWALISGVRLCENVIICAFRCAGLVCYTTIFMVQYCLVRYHAIVAHLTSRFAVQYDSSLPFSDEGLMRVSLQCTCDACEREIALITSRFFQ